MKVLVFGFSVTGDTPGYVEFWKKQYSAAHPDLTLEKIAIGGLSPPQGRHVVASMLRHYQPDILICEISTSIYRLRPETEQNILEHTETINFLIRLCRESGIRCGFLDLPQENLVSSRDWLGKIHNDLLESRGIPLVSVDLSPDTLRDTVHPNDAGRSIYADALERLLNKILTSPEGNTGLAQARTFFDVVHVEETTRNAGVLVDFERNGFRTKMLQLGAGQSATLRFDRSRTLVGVMVAMGPKTGYMDIRMNDVKQIIHCYDVHCYYLRVGARMFSPRSSESVTVVQGQKVPDTVLQKGTKDTGERVGGITHLLVQSDWPDHAFLDPIVTRRT